jgi:lipopolysaccharide/colanic/teichoic acid biosynthesis glycosyltransferase
VGLKCMLVRVDFSRLSLIKSETDFIFLIAPEEEARVTAVLSECRETTEVVVCATLSHNLEQDIVEQEILEIRRLLSKSSVLVVSSARLNSAQIAEVVCDAHLQGIRVLDLESALLELDPSVPADSSHVVQMMAREGLYQGASLQLYSGIKHAVEPVLAAILLVLISPLFVLIALMVKLTSPGPVFYSQTRLGYRRGLFDIIKFRSMRIDAEKDGPVWASTSRTDVRLTPIGGLLRATHLDELPQIWNVIRGDVSFVGPRPERPVFCQELEQKIPLFKLRTLMKPGITGWAQVRAGYANSVSDSQRKLEFDLYYILKHSPLLDLKILFYTVAIVFQGGSEGRKVERAQAAAAGPRQRAVLAGLTRRPSAAVDVGVSRDGSELVNVEIS